jgi:Cu(I)/Ag(I) efflux system protein CusF
VPVNGDYPGTGVITKINSQLGSIELDHNEIVGVMPAMKMEFFVSDKSLLDGLSVGEKVQFTVRYKDHTETIVDIKKPK